MQLPAFCNNMWFSLRLFFKTKQDWPWTCACLSLEPWQPIIMRMRGLWARDHADRCEAEEMLMVSVGDGVLGRNGKHLSECSVAEAVRETLDELTAAGVLRRDADLLKIEPFANWEDDEEGRLRNKNNEMKMSIDPSCRCLQPTATTELANLFLGSVLVRNSDIKMISMEAACQNGLQAAKLAAGFLGISPTRAVLPPVPPPVALTLLREFDRTLWKRGIFVPASLTLTALSIAILVVVILIIVAVAARSLGGTSQ